MQPSRPQSGASARPFSDGRTGGACLDVRHPPHATPLPGGWQAAGHATRRASVPTLGMAMLTIGTNRGGM